MKRHVSKPSGGANRQGRSVYSLEVCLIGGPITKAFAKRNKVVCRTIEVKGSQTLSALHNAIFEAFDREDEHMYEFQFGKGPHDPKGLRYVLPTEMRSPFSMNEKTAGDVTRTTIGSLGLQVGQAFGYWFDFGDDWYHQINVVGIADQVPKGKYPRITKRIGESPPQYADVD
jgi:uncharacterized protein (DUF2249 family)